jgi:VWFA-related protein
MKFFGFFLSIFFVFSAQAQQLDRDFDFRKNGSIVIKNLHGKVNVSAEEEQESRVSLKVDSQQALADSELKISNEGGRFQIAVVPQNPKSRVDVSLKVPLRSRVRVETRDGEVRIAGNVESADVATETGTISTDVPLDSLKFNFLWTASRPRYLSNAELDSEVKERSGGRFVLNGKLGDAALSKKEREKGKKGEGEAEESPDENSESEDADEQVSTDGKKNSKKQKKSREQKALESNAVSLNFTTERGIVLLNVNPTEVPSNLQERPLTEAAKAIVRSGDSLLMEAIRRSSPKYFGDYLQSLPPRRREPSLTEREKNDINRASSQIKQAVVKVTDLDNRAIGGLKKSDFTVQEYGTQREVLSVEPTNAPFNLVLLLDVSGSIDNYVDFIRKAARSFINTMRSDDKIAIIIFNEDVKQISTFTTDRSLLSESLDTFDAGGGTAFYDSLAYTLVETLKPLRGERTAVVVLSDGDDNRSFLPFDSLIGSIQESGALIYPLYVPSALIAASRTIDPDATSDPLRARYMALSSKSETEGARLAQVSGGVYYPIRRLEELQKAYDDIVVQLRTAYTVTYRSDSKEPTVENRASPRLRVRVSRENSFVTVKSVTDVPKVEAAKFEVRETSRKFDYADDETGASFRYVNASFITKNSFQPRGIALPQVPEITGEITDVKYKPLLTNDLQTIASAGFDINKSPPAFILDDGGNRIAVSRWVSPKRSRSYPYERIYNTLLHPKKATIIPVLKDEGAKGERDFLQFDTFSLLNLLDVYVILGYYTDATRDSAERITDQRFDNEFIIGKIRELQSFKGTATEWNLKELQNVGQILEKAKTGYAEISARTGVKMRDERGIDNFAKRINKSLEEFREFSRQKAQSAQNREFQMIQPNEALATDTKARITISDADGGKYFFTCDETKFENNTIYLIEAKHSSRAKMPSPSDIKDGLLKMMLYSNLKNVRLGDRKVSSRAAVRLTSNRLEGSISSESDAKDLENFLQTNRFNTNQRGFIKKLFEEARENNFVVIIEKDAAAK